METLLIGFAIGFVLSELLERIREATDARLAVHDAKVNYWNAKIDQIIASTDEEE